MIVSKKIKINKRHNRFLKYYSDLGYDVNSDFFLIDVEDLLKTSKNIVTSKCDYCASIVEIPYNQYTSSISRNGKFACSIKCARIPQLKIGFEFNDIYWHSELYKDKNYHINKTSFFEERGIRIIHIWEDDWDNKKEILKSQIKNWINLIDTRDVFPSSQ